MIQNSPFFVAVDDALKPNWLLGHLKSFSREQRDNFRCKMAETQSIFAFENGHPGGIRPIPPDGAVNHAWKKVHQNVPMIKEANVPERRKLPGVSIPLRWQVIHSIFLCN